MLTTQPSTNPPARPGPELVDSYRDHYPRLVRFAFSITGRRDAAEELVQEAFISAQTRWAAVRDYDDPSAWLRHVVANRCLSFQRKTGSEERALTLVASHEQVHRTTIQTSDVELTDADSDLWKAVRDLPRMQAAVVGLIFVDDQSAAQAATILGCSEDTVRTHLRRAKATLAARLIPPASSQPLQSQKDPS
jgi:RNA polymerase sigma factor (sigma-70 family)